jgi:hypothetical protein
LLHEVEGNWEDIDDILQEIDVNATQVAGSAAERGSRSVSRNRGLTQLHDQPVQNATGSATVGPVTQIASSSTQMAQDSTVTQGRKRGKPKGLKDKQPRSKLHSLSVPNFPFSMPSTSAHHSYNYGPVVISSHNADVNHLNDELLESLREELQSSDHIDSLSNARSRDGLTAEYLRNIVVLYLSEKYAPGSGLPSF